MRKSSVGLCAVTTAGALAAVLVPGITAETSRGGTVVTSITVNGGRSILLGPSEPVSFPVVVTASDRSGIRSVGPVGVWGPTYGALKVGPMRCTAQSATTSRCQGTVTVDPTRRQIFNDEAGTWFVDLKVLANDGDRLVGRTVAGFSLKRAARVTGSGVPAQTAVGQQVQVRGLLERSFWSDNGYHGYQGGVAYLQFRPSGSHLWTTVATAGSDASGGLAATVSVTGPGQYQWYSPGDKWTGDAVSDAIPTGVS